MKRYRVFSTDFDSRPSLLSFEIKDEWGEEVKRLHIENKQSVLKNLENEFGSSNFDKKIKNFQDLGDKPVSIIFYHNAFLEQIRHAFVVGSYYPALTGACSLGERILNQLMIELRSFYKNTSEYKKIWDKESFDNWDQVIDILKKWDVILPEVYEEFLQLKEKRNRAIHFNPEIDNQDRQLALEAIKCLFLIIRRQFGAFGNQPWFITTIPGEIYIKADWEDKPFIKNIYLPNSLLVGPNHVVTHVLPNFRIKDDTDYPKKVVSDEEFSSLRRNRKQGK